MDNKVPWKSKTLWCSLIVALAPFIPGAGPLIAANPGIVAGAVGAVFAGLRLISKGGISL